MEVRFLTKHFCSRWKQRVGALPSVEGVNLILCRSQRIRKQMRLFRRDGPRLVPVKVLAEYWDSRAQIIILVDEDERRAVTVLTAR
jgi:hypothetical protein